MEQEAYKLINNKNLTIPKILVKMKKKFNLFLINKSRIKKANRNKKV